MLTAYPHSSSSREDLHLCPSDGATLVLFCPPMEAVSRMIAPRRPLGGLPDCTSFSLDGRVVVWWAGTRAPGLGIPGEMTQ
jgi:hypothetical protein